MIVPAAIFLWRKVDAPGHDSCRLFKVAHGWRLSGAAVFLQSRHVCQLQYEVVANKGFRTRRAAVTGFVGKTAIDIRILAASGGRWMVNGTPHAGISGCLDVDLAFTPATNLFALRRLGLRVGEESDASAAYLAFPKIQFTVLPQRYKRVSRSEYAYLAPSVGYRGTLRVSPLGAVIRYPGLFEMVSLK
jgi:uncharacterized protein